MPNINFENATNAIWNALLDSLPTLGMAKESWGEREPSRPETEWGNLHLLWRQKILRIAAGYIVQEYRQFDSVTRIAIMGSVARPLWKEVPRFGNFRRYGIEVRHECKDVDLAVWVDTLNELNELRRARTAALNRMRNEHPNRMGVAHHQAEVFLLEPQTNRYLGRLCIFGTCPKDSKSDCRIEGCGSSPFLRAIEGLILDADAANEDRIIPLYERGRSTMLPPPGTAGLQDK